MTRLQLTIDVPGNVNLEEMLRLLHQNIEKEHGLSITLPAYDIFDVVLTDVKEMPDVLIT